MVYTRSQARLIDEQLGRVKYAGRFGKKLIAGDALRCQIRLVQGARRFLNRKVLRQRTLPQLADDRLRRRPHRSRFVHRLACSRKEAALQILSYAIRKEFELPSLNRRDQAGPENRTATEIELRLLADVVL